MNVLKLTSDFNSFFGFSSFGVIVFFQITEMPPAKKPVWDKFLSVTVNGVKKGKCKACNTEIVKLVQIACSIVTAVASSAGLERYFSTLGLTYGTLRSSLGVEKAGKMAFLFKQLNKD